MCLKVLGFYVSVVKRQLFVNFCKRIFFLQKLNFNLRLSRVNASFPQKAPTKNLSRNICRNPQILSQNALS